MPEVTRLRQPNDVASPRRPPVSSRTDPTVLASHILGSMTNGALVASSSGRATAGALLTGHYGKCLAAQGYKRGGIPLVALPCDAVPPLIRRGGEASPNAGNRA